MVFIQFWTLWYPRAVVVEMATNDSSPPKVQRSLKGFTTILASAACEWFLIFLLFIDAALSYLLTRFANYCELKIPCILCSRLDHVFGNEKPGFYWNLLCSNIDQRFHHWFPATFMASLLIVVVCVRIVSHHTLRKTNPTRICGGSF